MKQGNHKIIVSQQGVAFTQDALETMKQFAKTLSRENAHAVSWSITFDSSGEPVSGLGGDNEPQPNAIADQLEGFTFYWYTDERGMAAVRKRCVDVGYGRRSRLLPLPPDESR